MGGFCQRISQFLRLQDRLRIYHILVAVIVNIALLETTQDAIATKISINIEVERYIEYNFRIWTSNNDRSCNGSAGNIKAFLIIATVYADLRLGYKNVMKMKIQRTRMEYTAQYSLTLIDKES